MPILSTAKQCLALFCKNGVQYVWYENFIKKNIDILEYTSDVYYTKE